MSPVDAHLDARSAYVHIPFCSSVCPYCDFAVVAGADHMIDRYADAVISEIGMSQPWGPLNSVYFGGGTPSHVPPSVLGRILTTLQDHHGIGAGAEVSLEANPEDFSEARAGELSQIGFNRVSFGAQSFDRAVLEALGRRHGPEQIMASVAAARGAAIGSISVDLIFGTPLETDQSWAHSLLSAIEASPDHVSCYALTVEPGTPLNRAVIAGAAAPDPDVQADRYEMAQASLEAAGYHRYEVSNWCRPGHECRYNLTVWAQGQYEAYGNGAHRFRDGVRSRNVRRLDAYLSEVAAGRRPIAGAEPVTGWDTEIDRLFVGLRRSAGVSDGPGVQSLVGSAEGKLLQEAGVIEMSGGRLVVRRPLLTDEVHRAVLGLEAPIGWVEPPTPDNVW
ncbi:MAG TPA: radical SAM family heme chaperone HemW [Acidimicrobiia bacterium]|nr:radical SAM family heme chaperone HemW [Acidimicrobiia bacterium]